MIVGRLQKVLTQRNIANFQEYIKALENDQTGILLDELANRISTNHTHFWREPAHFHYFSKHVIPWVKGLGKKDFRLWCAASATGEEPWTLAMLLRDGLGHDYSSWNAGLISTDISVPALQTAQAGIYDDNRVNPLPEHLKKIGFNKTSQGQWEIRDELRQDSLFRRFNLINEKLPFKQLFHCIFIRNVMIYFDQATRKALIERLAKQLEPGGWLFVGHSESLGRDNKDFNYIQPAVYQKVSL